jgi:hypothetical protein
MTMIVPSAFVDFLMVSAIIRITVTTLFTPSVLTPGLIKIIGVLCAEQKYAYLGLLLNGLILIHETQQT